MTGIVIDKPFSGVGDIILYGFGLYIVYKILTSWNIISSGSTNSINNILNWKPLTNEQLQNIQDKLNNYN